MGKSHRPQRLGEEIKKSIGDLLVRGQLKDPGFSGGLISVNAVDVTGDGSYATVYVSAMDFGSGQTSPERKREILKAFEKSKGHIRSEIGKTLRARHVPELLFKYDESLEYGAKMDAILDSLDISLDDPAAMENASMENASEEDFDD